MEQKTRWDNSPISDGINNNTYRLLFEEHPNNLPREKSGSYENYIAINTIREFTLVNALKKDTKIQKFLKKLTEGVDIKRISYNEKTKQYEYKHNNFIVYFDLLSNHCGIPEIVNELTTEKRYNKCHLSCWDLVEQIEDAKVVTGFLIWGTTQLLHTLMELNSKGETYVLDYAFNLFIKKEEYLKLTNFKEISSYTAEEVVEYKLLGYGNIDMGIKPILTFRDELVKDMQKNPQMFQPTAIGLARTREYREKHNK